MTTKEKQPRIKEEVKVITRHITFKIYSETEQSFFAWAKTESGEKLEEEFSILDYAGSKGLAEDAARFWVNSNHHDPFKSKHSFIEKLPNRKGYQLKWRTADNVLTEEFLSKEHGSIEEALKEANRQGDFLKEMPHWYQNFVEVRTTNSKEKRSYSTIEESEYNLHFHGDPDEPEKAFLTAKVKVRALVTDELKAFTKTFKVSDYGLDIEKAKEAGRSWKRDMIILSRDEMRDQMHKLAKGRSMNSIKKGNAIRAGKLKSKINKLQQELSLLEEGKA